MRVAIPTKNNRIDPQYSRAAEFTIYEIEIELVKKKEIVPLGKTAIADFLTEQDINAVICGNIVDMRSIHLKHAGKFRLANLALRAQAACVSPNHFTNVSMCYRASLA